MLGRYSPSVREQYARPDEYPTTLDLFSRVTMGRYPFMRDHVDVLVGNSRTVDLGDRRFDFCLIDGDHTYEGVRADYDKVLPNMQRGSVLVFQDVSTSFPGVQALAEELDAAPEVTQIAARETCVAFEIGVQPQPTGRR
jgi:hypothetical protein